MESPLKNIYLYIYQQYFIFETILTIFNFLLLHVTDTHTLDLIRVYIEMNYYTFIKQIKLLTQNKHVFLHSKVYSTLKSNMQTLKNCIMNILFHFSSYNLTVLVVLLASNTVETFKSFSITHIIIIILF